MPEASIASPPGDGGPAISPLGHFLRFILRCRLVDIDSVSDAIGMKLPRDVCRSAQADALKALWLGPDEWLILRVADGAGAEPALRARLAGTPCSLVDVSHRQVALAVQGPRAEDILASGCALDLSIGAFPVGMCTRTMFAKAEIVLWRTATASFHLEVWRSFAPYVETLLRQAESEAENADRS